MARFDRQIATALRLIAKNGQVVTWQSVENAASVDPDQPWKPSGTTTTERTATICFLPINREGRETIAYLKGSGVATGSVYGLMGNVNFTPTAKDVVLRDGVEMRIENVDLLSPNGQKILYTIEFAG